MNPIVKDRRVNRYLYKCDGCGKEHCMNIGDEDPKGWLFSTRDWHSNTWPWATSIVACSADCVHDAKLNVKKRARESLAKFDARIDAARLVRA